MGLQITKNCIVEEELINALMKQLRSAHAQIQEMQVILQKVEEKLTIKDQKIDRLEQKISEWDAKCKQKELLSKKEYQQTRNEVDRSDHLCNKCCILEQKIYEMETFLADYGLKWVGDDGGTKKQETIEIKNYIETYYDQIVANIDQLNFTAGKGELQVHRDEKGATFKIPSCLSLKFYKNGMVVQEGSLRSYNDASAMSFIRDILDGYFPSELEETYPDGVPFEIEDRRTQVYKNESTVFSGQGYRLGKQS
ncbi:hypothetical protein KM043_013163 [Ampulex compressa]|nr:hypothetical protein KM043_013163 [Ampulex compressa]